MRHTLKRWGWLIALAGTLSYAQPVVVVGPATDNITSSHARVHWITDVASTTAIEYGTTSALGKVMIANWVNLFTIHNWYISGLAANTTFFYRGCSALETFSGWTASANTITINSHGFTNGTLVQLNAGTNGTPYSLRNYGTYYVVNATTNTFQLSNTLGGAAVTISGTLSGTTKIGRAACTTTSTFTTTAEGPNGVAAPIPPAVTIPNVPTIDGNTYTVDSTCSNLNSILTTVGALTGSANHQVVIPAGVECRGQWVFPARPSHTGWVVVRTGASDQQIPPPGVRSRQEFLPNYGILTSDAFPLGNWLSAGTLVNVPCSGRGQMDFMNSPSLNGTGLTPLYICVTPNLTPVAKSIEAIASASGVVSIKITGHGYRTGHMVRIDSTGNSSLDARGYPIAVLDADHFQLYGTSGTVTPCSGTCVGTAKADLGRLPATNSFHGPAANKPASCADGQTWIDEATVNPNVIYWCDNGNWLPFRAVNQPAGLTMLQFAFNASQYRFIGLEMQHARFPQTIPSGWGLDDQRQGRMGGLIRTRPSNSDIIFDRCEIHSHDYPNRTGGMLTLNGTRIGVINSRVYNGVSWAIHPHPSLLEVNMIQIQQGSGGFFQNNYFQGAGITMIVADGNQQSASEPATADIPLQFARPPADYIIRRNLFFKDPIHRGGTPENYLTGRTYANRHHLEWKRGQRFLVDGNVFFNNWSKSVQGASILVSPVNTIAAWVTSPIVSTSSAGDVIVSTTAFDNAVVGEPVAITGASNSAHNGIWTVASVSPSTSTIRLTGLPAVSSTGGTLTALGSTMAVSDLDWTNNTIRHSAVGSLLNGHGVQAGPITKQTQRIRVRNNLFFDINKRACTDFVVAFKVCDAAAGPPYGYNDSTGLSPQGGSAFAMSATLGPEDYTIENNSAIDVQGNGDQEFFDHDVISGSGKGGVIRNNLWIAAGSGTSVPLGVNTPFGTMGANALDEAWTRYGSATPGWISSNNAFCCGVNSPSTYAAVASLPASRAAFSFWDDPSRNYRLRFDSPYISGGASRGSDDRDVGADIDALEAAQGVVRNAHTWGVSSTAATVSYLAPDTDVCTVEFGTSANWGTGSRASDAGGARQRGVSLTGLTPATQYFYRVLCAVEQPSGTFKTAP